MTDADILRLRGPAGAAVLALLPPYDSAQVLTVADELRRAGHDPTLVSAALTQSRLRARATVKFGDRATRMLFTADGLEQASRGPVAQRHAERFVQAEVRHVWDLGCGIGSDAWAFAGAGLGVTAVDLDPVSVEVARANLADYADVQVCRGRAEEVELPLTSGQACWLDPARRVSGVADAHGRTRRVSGLSQLSPSWDFVRTLHERVGSVGAKLAPSFPRTEVPAGVEAQWLSFGGEALEASLWWGDLAHRPGVGVAVHDGSRWHTIGSRPPIGHDHQGAPGVRVGEYLYDPDRAVLAAGRLDAVHEAVQGATLWPGAGYVTAQRAVDTPFARCLRVREVLPLRPKVVREWARQHDIGALTLKKHGGGVDPEALRAQVRPRGGTPATLVLTREPHGSGSRAIAVWVSPA